MTDGDNWWLPAAAELPITAAGAVDQMAPLPTLTSIGTLGNETVLVDLERLGSVGLQGDPDGCRHLMAHMVTELAHQTWSDGVTVTLVGWGRHLVPLNPDRLSYSPSPRDVTRVLKARDPGGRSGTGRTGHRRRRRPDRRTSPETPGPRTSC